MSTLRFKELEPKRGGRTKPLLTILGIGALVGALALGSTLAASITLSSDNNVEFGQGVVTTAACDGSINVNPVSSFVNASATPAARFNLSSIAFTGIDTSTLAGGTSTTEGCAGKTLTIKAYGETGNALTLVTGVTSVDVVVSAIGTNFTESTNNVSITSQNQTSFTLTLDSLYSPIAADQVYKITIESSDSIGDGTESNPGFSASQIKSDYPESLSGWYWITNPNIQSGAPFQIYADMSDPDNPWTLVLANGNRSDWTPNELLRVQSLESTPPLVTNNLVAIGVKYSILEWADYLKKSVGNNELEIRITSPRTDLPDFVGIWRAPFGTSFTGNDSSLVALNRVTAPVSQRLEDFMPYLTTDGVRGQNKNSLTMCRDICWWSTLAASTSHGGGMPFDTVRTILMYWVKS